MTAIDYLKDKEHFKIYADLSLDTVENAELAKVLSIPPVEDRQPDLQYLTSLFVSSGMNLNGAFFLPSELLLAHRSASGKPLDIEHQEDQIVGHINAHAFVYKDGSVLDPESLLANMETGVENTPIDLITSSTIYETRFPQFAADVDDRKYKVSL